MIHIGRWSKGLRGFLSPPLKRGFKSDFNHSCGENPVLKQMLNSLCNSFFAWSFFNASFGTKRNALPSLALSMAADTSLKVISQFNMVESNEDFAFCSSELRLSNSAFRYLPT